jgi:hypothetical protein
MRRLARFGVWCAFALGGVLLTATPAMATTKTITSRALTTKFAIEPPPPVCTDRDHDGDCDAPGQR